MYKIPIQITIDTARLKYWTEGKKGEKADKSAEKKWS